MPTVFINYRREDAAGEARALFNELRAKFGPDAVFMDVETIALGRDFRDALAERLATVDVMLALIGKGWLESCNQAGKRRLDDPNDFVRREIRAALERDIAVTPVLLQDAQMPAEADLPPDIRNLAFRNAFEISHARWGSDVNELIHRLGLAGSRSAAGAMVTAGEADSVTTEQRPKALAEANAPGRRPRTLWWAIVAAAAVLLAATGGYVYVQSVRVDRAGLQQAKADLADARERQSEAAARAASEAAMRQRLEEAQAEAKRVAEAKERAEQAVKTAADEQRRLESARIEKERAELERTKRVRAEQARAEQDRLEKERVAKEKAAKDQAEKERAEKERAEKERAEKERAEKGQAAPPPPGLQSDVAARQMADVRAGKFLGSISVSLGTYAEWKQLDWVRMSSGGASAPCNVWSRQVKADERLVFLELCLGGPAYYSRGPLARRSRVGANEWMAYCHELVSAKGLSGDDRKVFVGTCLRYR